MLERELVSNSLFNLNEYHLHDYALKCTTVDAISFEMPENESEFRAKADTECKSVAAEIKQFIHACYSWQDFDPVGATHVITSVQSFFKNFPKSKPSFAFTKNFEIKFIVDICKCAANEFIKLKQWLKNNHHPVAEVRKQKPDILTLFTISGQSEAERAAAAVEYVFKNILKRLYEFVAINLRGWITKHISKINICCLTKKENFFSQILIDIGEGDATFFGEYIKYLEDENDFMRQKTQQYLRQALGCDDFKEVLQNEINNLRQQLLAALSRLMNSDTGDAQNQGTENSLSSWTNYFKQLNVNLNYETNNQSFLFPTSDSCILDGFEIHDFKQFTQLLSTKLSQRDFWESLIADVKSQSKCNTGNFDSVELISYLENTFGFGNIADSLFEKLVGCTEKCPYCRAPCYYENANHAFKHNTMQHRPWGVIGIKSNDTNELVTYNCQSAKGSDQHGFTNLAILGGNECQLNQLARESEWEIKPDPTLQSSLYWRWFMNRFNKELADHFKTTPGCLPKEWTQIQWGDAKQSLFEGENVLQITLLPMHCK